MPELARSIVSRFRQLVGDRRRSKRQKVRLVFSISTASPAKNLNGARRIRTMEGHTLDVSASGLALVVPAITLDEHHLIGENRTLNLKLQLPVGPIEIQVKPVRYESLEDHETESGYLIGVQIVGISDEDRAKFTQYMSTLSHHG
jgi:hypothetical protein